jgi:predicted HTH domain antitoxin
MSALRVVAGARRVASATMAGAMAAITLEIPEEIAAALRFPPSRVGEELRREFAVFLVKEGFLPRHEARVLAAMERVAFEDLLARRGVAWEGTADEVFGDVEAAERVLGP